MTASTVTGQLDLDARTRTATLDGRPVHLTRIEWALLAKLASDRGRVFTKAELLRDVWGIRDPSIRTRTLDDHVSRLRRKLGGGIRNVWGYGYSLEAGARS